jgi:opacity protein-like surface antigen
MTRFFKRAFVQSLVLLATLAVLGGVCTAQPRAGAAATGVLLDVSGEYYYPTHSSRRVHSAFLNAAIGAEVVRPLRLYALAGLTFTFADGDIVQWNDSFEDVRYRARAAGLGPMFLLRAMPVQLGRLSIGAEMVGAILLYSSRFPPGGDIYNFTWRFGGAVGYQLTERLQLTVGMRWMHVSNGQGLGPQNPSYEAIGFPIALSLEL